MRPGHRKGALAMRVYAYFWQLAKTRGYAEIEGVIDVKDKDLAGFYRALGARSEEALLYYIDIDGMPLPPNAQGDT